MKIVMVVLAGLLLSGCAGLGAGLQSASDSINKGVARTGDQPVNVRVVQ